MSCRAATGCGHGAAARNISSRPRTAATVGWAPTGWASAGSRVADQQTPDLSSVGQEIVSRPDWARGNVVVLIVTGTRIAEPCEGGATRAPVLHVEYSGGEAVGGGVVTGVAADDGDAIQVPGGKSRHRRP